MRQGKQTALRVLWRALALLCGTSMLMLPYGVAAASAKWPIALRFEWGGGGQVSWDGELRVLGGSVQAVSPYLMERGEWARRKSSTEVTWHSETAGPTDGMDVKLSARPDTVLEFRSKVGMWRTTVGALVAHPATVQLDRDGHELSIERVPASVLARTALRDTYIFKPDEAWQPKWLIDFGFPSNRAYLDGHVVVRNAVTNRRVATWPCPRAHVSKRLRVLMACSVQLPAKEGVYDVRLHLVKPPIALPPTMTQVIVLNPKHGPVGTPVGTSTPMRLVEKIIPRRRYDDATFRDDGTSRLIVRDGVLLRVSGTHGDRAWRSGLKSRQANWFAYRLHGLHPGVPYVLEIKYPVDKARAFVLSVLEQGPVRGARSRNGLDVGIAAHRQTESGEKLPLKTHKIVFWPTTPNPALLITNALTGSAAAVAGIRVYEAPEGLPVRKLSRAQAAVLHGPYYEEGSFYLGLGAPEAVDTARKDRTGTRPDWVTFYTAVNHLCELMRMHGDTAAAMVVYGYGGTLYPSKVLSNNGRYDSGMDFGDRRDPVQKDVVRLLLDIFHRNHLKLIPVFEFYRPLASLNKRYPKDAAGVRSIDLLNRYGQTSRSVFKLNRRLAVGPTYTPLHPAVQAKIAAAIHEFVNRYKDSPALGDVAIQLNTTGWTQFPGMAWGYGATAFAEFSADEGLAPPKALAQRDAAAARFEYIRSHGLWTAWVQWRNRKLRDFYVALGKSIYQTSERHLVLAYMNIFTSRFAQPSGERALSEGISPKKLLAWKGVSPEEYAGSPWVRIWRPIRTPILFDRKSEQDGVPSALPETVALFRRAGNAGAIEFYDYYESRLDSVEKRWWWPIDFWMVATFKAGSAPPIAVDSAKELFRGGWEYPQ